MNENLSQMVRENVTNEETITYDDQIEQTESQATVDSYVVSVVPMIDWFDSNINNFPNIRKPTVSIQGVDSNEQLIITISVPGSDEKRRLVVFDNAHEALVLNIPAVDMQVYNNNNFRIIYDFGNGIFIKAYSVKTGLISVFCNDIEDVLVPYATVRSKKSSTEVEVPVNDISIVKEKVTQPLDFEALQLRYRQSSKAEGLQTNMDAIKWLVEKQGTIFDINHHLQIDNAIIDMLS